MQSKNSRELISAPEGRPTLLFAPLAWLKLQWFCHAGDTEIGGFGISAERNPLYVEDFMTVRQRVTSVSVQFEDDAIADFFDTCVDRGIRPERCVRLWMHTHPMASPMPSGVDEDTFASKFGKCDWAVMFILGRTGLTYARLAFSAGPGGQTILPVNVHWAALPQVLGKAGSLDTKVSEWQQEFVANIHPPASPSLGGVAPTTEKTSREPDPWWDTLPWSDELDAVYYELSSLGESHEPYW